MFHTYRKVLVIAGLVFCLTSSVFAYSGGSGEPNDPYLIATPADMNTLGTTSGDWSKCFKLVADINMAGFTGTQYKIIGNDTTKFTGTFDGNDHIISNLTYTTTDYVGYASMFGNALNATIKNLGIEDVNFSALSDYPGSLAGYVSYCTISNCYSTGKVVAMLSVSSSYGAGGLVGYQNYGNIINCHSTVSVTSASYNIGGLVGYQNYGSITNCYSTGSVTASYYAVIGGLVGYQKYGNITNCYSTGAVTSSSYNSRIGGLVGCDYHGNITSCYAAGDVNGISNNVGGLVGYILGDSTITIKNCYATGGVNGISNVGGLVGTNNYTSKISNCYATGAVSGTSNVGGLVGENGISISNCFWDIETSGQSSGVGYGSPTGVTGKMTTDMKKLSTFADAMWNIADINGAETDWVMLPDGQDYPKINFLFCHDCFAAIPVLGNGTEEDPYQIQSAADFVALGNYCNAWDKYIVLTADVDLNGLVIRPIGNSMVRFTGNFDGQGFVVRNAKINMPDKNYVGLFGRVGNGGVVADLGVEDVNIVGKKFVGGLIGFNSGTISNCYSTGLAALNSSSFAGGLIGFSSSGTISDCCSAVNISGSATAIGGLVGGNGKRNVISNCCASGTITDTNSNRFGSCAGGLIGSNSGTIYDSYATGNIAAIFNSSSAYVYLGGMAGDNIYGTISGSYATGNISVTSNPSTATISAGGLVGLNKSNDVNDCYATGQITFNCSATSKYLVGGVVGLNFGNINRCYSKCAIGSGESAEADCSVGGAVGFNIDGVVAGCFWDIQTSGKTTSGGGKGLTTEQMKTMLIYQNAGWADNGWVMQDGIDYPRLEWEDTEGVPIPAAGALPLSGSGTEADPYQVWTAADFAYLSWYKSVLDKHIILMADIDLAGIRVCPIGDLGIFTGIFDGNGHTVRNIQIYEPTNSNIGVFSRVGTDGVVKGLCVRDAEIVGGGYVGGLIGKNEGGDINSCGVTGTIDGFGYVGGLIGKSESNTVTKCYSTAAVTAWDSNGFIFYAGGLIGNSGSTINNSYATGAVTCPYSSNYSRAYAGGLVGYSGVTIDKCYSAGYISATGGKLSKGGMLGAGTNTATKCFWDTQTSGMTTSAGGTGVVGKTTAQMRSAITFLNAGWNFMNIWTIYSAQYPSLAWQVNIIVPDVVAMTQADAENAIVAAGLVVGTITSSYSGTVPQGCIISQNPAAGIAVEYGMSVNIVVSLGSCYSGGDGTETNPYQIADINGLLALAATPAEYNKCFILTADIDLGGQVSTKAIIAADTDSNSSFQGTPFTGTFDGNGHKITHFTINGTGNSNLGLFGQVNTGGSVKNLGLEYFSVSGSSYIGGLLGYNYGGNISNCYSTGTVNGSSFVGGLVGWNYSGGSISNCYSTSSVSGSSYVGGLVGCNGTGSNSGSISNCYSTGFVSGSSNIGGLVGYNNFGNSISASFWDVNTSGQMTSSGGTGKTTIEMQDVNTFLTAGWDFLGETGNGTDDIWRMCVDGVYYPHLKWEYSKRGDFICPDGVCFEDLLVLCEQWLLEKLSADIEPDGIVNFLDYANFANSWQSDMNGLADFSAQWLKSSDYKADIDIAPAGGDGVVNMLDFAVLADNWFEGQ